MNKTLAALSFLILTLSAINAHAVPPWPQGATPAEIQSARKAFKAQMRRSLPSNEVGAAETAYKDIFQSVDASRLQALLKDMSGVNPVSVGGQTFTISERYSPEGKANYRKYWSQYFRNLGMAVQEFSYPNSHGNGETDGHNVEAILPGRSPDSIVIIVHYDSIGPTGPDNPGADDDMSGMAMMMETARILAARRGQLQHTVRFVAADYEEWGGLEGARSYAKYIAALAKQNNFKIVAGIDDEQSGWNEGGGDTFDLFSCGGATDSTALGDLLAETAQVYSRMQTTRGCMGENSDHYALWEIGVPAVVFSEHDPFNNPHFDKEGGDTYDTIDTDYFFRIAQVGITFAARVVGLTPRAKVAAKIDTYGLAELSATNRFSDDSLRRDLQNQLGLNSSR